MNMELRFSKFRKEDFPELQTWYEDAELNTHLGPMDEEWLNCVLSLRSHFPKPRRVETRLGQYKKGSEPRTKVRG
jgi:hypothetical protein